MGKLCETMGKLCETMGKSLGKVWEINGNITWGFHENLGNRSVFRGESSGESPWDIIGIVLSCGAAGILSKRFMFFVLFMDHESP